MTIWKRMRTDSESGFGPTYRFSTSWILTPGLLFTLRALLSLYAFTTIFTIFGYDGVNGQAEDARRSFSYFTNLTYWGLAFYFAFAAAHTASYWLTGTPFLARWPQLLQSLHSIFYSTIVVFPWLVTIVFWGLLYSGFRTKFSAWTNISQHALNSVFALFEIIFPRTAPLPFLHIIPIIVILGMYLGLAYVTYDTEHFFVYNFLNNKTHSHGVVAAYCVGILVVAIILFLVVRYLIMLRLWLTEKKMGMTGKTTSRRGVRLASSEAERGMHLLDMPVK